MQLKFILPAVLLSGAVYAQDISSIAAEKQLIAQPVNLQQANDFQSENLNTESEIPNLAPLAAITQVYDGVMETVIGTTTYDLQTNRSVQNRLVSHGSGKLSAVWTMSDEDGPDFTNRGTGYNYFDGNDWLDQPENRIETVRTGWPSLLSLGNGNEVFLSHVFTDPTGANEFGMRDTAGTSTWNMGTVSSGSSDLAISWIRMVNGGTDGNTIHIIGHKKFPELVEGTNNPGYISYSRSTDGGTTWDIHDSILPEIDSSFYTPFGGDGYAMTAKGNTVAFVIGGADRDVVLMKSTDNGSTWTKSIIWDFPIEKFDPTIHLIDTTTFDGGTINTSDGSYSISLDSDGDAHVFFGNYHLSNPVLDEGTNYSIFADGLFHWEESYGATDTINAFQMFDTLAWTLTNAFVDDLPDGRDNIAPYFQSLNSFPHSTIDSNGDIYVTYSGVIPTGLYSEQLTDEAQYDRVFRHQYLVRSQDGGSTWSAPRDLLAELIKNTEENYWEAVYGNVIIQDGYIYVMYQRDEIPGINITQPDNNEVHDVTVNEIVVVKVAVADFNLIGIEEVSAFTSTNIFPNPANNQINVRFDLDQAQNATISIVNMIGQTMLSTEVDADLSNTVSMNVSSLNAGVYFVKIAAGKSTITEKLVIK